MWKEFDLSGISVFDSKYCCLHVTTEGDGIFFAYFWDGDDLLLQLQNLEKGLWFGADGPPPLKKEFPPTEAGLVAAANWFVVEAERQTKVWREVRQKERAQAARKKARRLARLSGGKGKGNAVQTAHGALTLC